MALGFHTEGSSSGNLESYINDLNVFVYSYTHFGSVIIRSQIVVLLLSLICR